MPYKFDEIADRRGTNSLKWDSDTGVLPMWVADMDFWTAPEIIETVRKKADLGIYGYTIVPDQWYDSIVSWWGRRHHFDIEKEWLMFCTGVVPAISSIVRKLTTPGENILTLTPVYNIFFNSIVNNGRNVLESRLLFDGMEYHIDFDDLKEKLSDPQTTMLLLCNPHNPVGKIWEKETLQKIGELCEKYHVLVVSDEIHCDLTEPGYEYVPFASVSETCRNNSITCLAPTKAFNLAGLQTAAVMVPNGNIRHKVNRGLNTDEAAEPNVFAAEAAIAAFSYGEAWLDELCGYLWANRAFAKEYITKNIPSIRPVPAHATYLLWLDCRKIIGCSAELAGFLKKHHGLYLCDGNEYRNGDGFLRMNIACPRRLVEDGLRRLKEGILDYEKEVVSRC